MNDIKEGVKEVIVDNNIYKCWTLADVTKGYITNFLKEYFPKGIIVYEINNIDIVIFDEGDDIIPVEIQTTQVAPDLRFQHSSFEDLIRKQIEDNIENYEKCWLFFDSEYLRYLQGGNISTTTSINMNWLVKYIKENKLKVFVIKYNGEMIRELSIKDFDFLKDMSMTCPLGHDKDGRILNRNKLKIFRDVIRSYSFKPDEIDKIHNNAAKNGKTIRSLLKDGNEREKLYSQIIKSIGILMSINEILDMNMSREYGKLEATYLGIFDVKGMGSGSVTTFFDRFDICKHFPGYLRNKDTWDKLKGHILNNRQFKNIVTKKIDTNKGIDYFWYENR